MTEVGGTCGMFQKPNIIISRVFGITHKETKIERGKD